MGVSAHEGEPVAPAPCAEVVSVHHGSTARRAGSLGILEVGGFLCNCCQDVAGDDALEDMSKLAPPPMVLAR